MRPITIQRLTSGQFRTALNEEKPVLHVLAEQEKSRVEHYVPLHPSVVRAISEVLAHDFGEKDGREAFLMIVDQTGTFNFRVQQKVSKLEAKVSKLQSENDLNKRLLDLESDIELLKSAIFDTELAELSETKNRWARPDSNRRPPSSQDGGFSGF